jgi:hypothetical protein
LYKVQNKGVVITLYKVQIKDIVLFHVKFKIKVSLHKVQRGRITLHEVKNKELALLFTQCKIKLSYYFVCLVVSCNNTFRRSRAGGQYVAHGSI